MVNTRIRTLGLAFACAAGLGACANSSETYSGADMTGARPDDVYLSAKALFLSAQYGFAVTRVDAFLRIEPQSLKGLNLAGAIYDSLGRFDLSRGFYEKALILSPGDETTRANFAVSLARQGVPSQAGPLAAPTMPVVIEPVSLIGPMPMKTASVSPNVSVVIDEASSPTSKPMPVAALVESPVIATPMAFSEPIVLARPPQRTASAWIERRGPYNSFLVINPDQQLVARMTLLNLEPRTSVVTRLEMAPRVLALATQPSTDGGGRGPSQEAVLRIEVANGVGRTGMARRTARLLGSAIGADFRLTNAKPYGTAITAIEIRDESYKDEARRIQAMLGIAPAVRVNGAIRGDLRLRIGRDLLAFDERGRVNAPTATLAPDRNPNARNL